MVHLNTDDEYTSDCIVFKDIFRNLVIYLIDDEFLIVYKIDTHSGNSILDGTNLNHAILQIQCSLKIMVRKHDITKSRFIIEVEGPIKLESDEIKRIADDCIFFHGSEFIDLGVYELLIELSRDEDFLMIYRITRGCLETIILEHSEIRYFVAEEEVKIPKRISQYYDSEIIKGRFLQYKERIRDFSWPELTNDSDASKSLQNDQKNSLDTGFANNQDLITNECSLITTAETMNTSTSFKKYPSSECIEIHCSVHKNPKYSFSAKKMILDEQISHLQISTHPPCNVGFTNERSPSSLQTGFNLSNEMDSRISLTNKPDGKNLESSLSKQPGEKDYMTIIPDKLDEKSYYTDASEQSCEFNPTAGIPNESGDKYSKNYVFNVSYKMEAQAKISNNCHTTDLKSNGTAIFDEMGWKASSLIKPHKMTSKSNISNKSSNTGHIINKIDEFPELISAKNTLNQNREALIDNDQPNKFFDPDYHQNQQLKSFDQEYGSNFFSNEIDEAKDNTPEKKDINLPSFSDVSYGLKKGFQANKTQNINCCSKLSSNEISLETNHLQISPSSKPNPHDNKTEISVEFKKTREYPGIYSNQNIELGENVVTNARNLVKQDTDSEYKQVNTRTLNQNPSEITSIHEIIRNITQIQTGNQKGDSKGSSKGCSNQKDYLNLVGDCMNSKNRIFARKNNTLIPEDFIYFLKISAMSQNVCVKSREIFMFKTKDGFPFKDNCYSIGFLNKSVPQTCFDFCHGNSECISNSKLCKNKNRCHSSHEPNFYSGKEKKRHSEFYIDNQFGRKESNKQHHRSDLKILKMSQSNSTSLENTQKKDIFYSESFFSDSYRFGHIKYTKNISKKFISDTKKTLHQVLLKMYQEFDYEIENIDSFLKPSSIYGMDVLERYYSSKFATFEDSNVVENIGIMAFYINIGINNFIVVQNDIFCHNGSFSIYEDIFFTILTKTASRMGLPIVFVSCNSGARIGLSEINKKNIVVEPLFSRNDEDRISSNENVIQAHKKAQPRIENVSQIDIEPSLMNKDTDTGLMNEKFNHTYCKTPLLNKNFSLTDIEITMSNKNSNQSTPKTIPISEKSIVTQDNTQVCNAKTPNPIKTDHSLVIDVANKYVHQKNDEVHPCNLNEKTKHDKLFDKALFFESDKFLAKIKTPYKSLVSKHNKIISIYENITTGPENLAFSGLIAGVMRQAYRKTTTLSYISGRSVGIGAYLNKLGQRMIIKENSPLLLTGSKALNKLLQKEVYKDNNEVGGPDIMEQNGNCHKKVINDYQGAREIIRWLNFVSNSHYFARKYIKVLSKTLMNDFLSTKPNEHSIQFLHHALYIIYKSLKIGKKDEIPEFHVLSDFLMNLSNLECLAGDLLSQVTQHEILKNNLNSRKVNLLDLSTDTYGLKQYEKSIEEETTKESSFLKKYNDSRFNEKYTEREIVETIFDKKSIVEYKSKYASNITIARAMLSQKSFGLIFTESSYTNFSNLQLAPNVIFSETADKIAQGIKDFSHENLNILIIASFRGFGGSREDMTKNILKFGSEIVEAVLYCKTPITFYIPPDGELRGGSWVVFDQQIGNKMRMFAHPRSSAGILEAEGIAELKFKKDVHRKIKRSINCDSDIDFDKRMAIEFCKLHDQIYRMYKNNLIENVFFVSELRDYLRKMK